MVVHICPIFRLRRINNCGMTVRKTLQKEVFFMICPACGSGNTVRNGTVFSGKQKHICKECGRQFVEDPADRTVPQETKDLVDILLLEKIPLAGIVRVTGVSKRWLQYYVNKKYDEIPKTVSVSDKEKGRLTVECDEMWSFVGNKGSKVWIWLAKDTETKEIAGVHLGSRDRDGALGLWDSLPGVYRQCAVCYTDFRAAYEGVLPPMRHRATEKGSGKTNNIESFNCTIRQRVSRLVRKTLSFSKKIENHIGAIWNFVHNYNASLA